MTPTSHLQGAQMGLGVQGSLVLRGFYGKRRPHESRNVKQDSEGSNATGGVRQSLTLPDEKNSAPNLST
jgi:hypothetical protein